MAGNRIGEQVLDATGNVVRTKTQQFDAMNQLVKLIGGYGQVTTYSYDGNGNATGQDDPLHHASVAAIDALNRIKSVTDAAQGLLTATYDTNDQLRRLVDPMGFLSDLTVNALGDVSQVSLPAVDGDIDPATYDAAGNLRSKTDFRNVTTSYSYDALNRLIAISAPNAAAITFTYDEGSNGIGRMTRMSDASGITRWSYDIFGRVVSETRQTAGLSLGLNYTYATGGQVASITYPSGRTVSYAYTRGQLSSVSVDGTVLASAMRSQPFGAATGWTWANGQDYQRSYDLDGRLSDFSMGAGRQTLQYDPAGRLIGIVESTGAVRNQAFGYDALDRVTSYNGPLPGVRASSLGYEYDRNGNRTTHTIGGRTYTYGYSAGQNTLASVSGPQPQTWALLDASTLSDGTHSFSFDSYLRQTAVTTTGVRVNYLIDGMGRRVSKVQQSGAATHFVYGPAGELLAELNASGSATIEYVWLPGSGDAPQPIAVSPGSRGALNYVFSDQLNTPRLVTNPAGVELWRWISDPFGNTIAQSSVRDLKINLRFAGQYYDEESGLHYNWHRYYDPRSGRYVQSDPIGLEGGFNTLLYANATPTMYTDSDGLQVPMPRPLFPGLPSPGTPSPRPIDPTEPNGPKYTPAPRWPSLPDWLTRPFTQSSLDRCEADCDAKYDNDQKLCEAWWKTTGRDSGAYRTCIARARAKHILCFQNCKKDCEQRMRND